VLSPAHAGFDGVPLVIVCLGRVPLKLVTNSKLTLDPPAPAQLFTVSRIICSSAGSKPRDIKTSTVDPEGQDNWLPVPGTGVGHVCPLTGGDGSDK
jgi:hypothetical protein